MKKVVCFGEALLRLTPDAAGQWLQQNQLPVYIAGAELNVATALALWGIPASYCTALPDNFLGRQVLQFIRQKHIDTAPVLLEGNRLGIYYLPMGTDLKQGGVIYDRSGSSFAQLQPGKIDWQSVLHGAEWLHISAICPALNASVAEVCKEAMMKARELNITVSIDLNYRESLWKYGKSPVEIIPSLVQYCDVIMGNIWSIHTMLGIPVADRIKEIDKKEVYLQQAEASSRSIMAAYPQCRAVANTFRFDHQGLLYYATLFDGKSLYTSSEHSAPSVIDKVGSGDCFMAGLIYGYLQKFDPAGIINYAAAAAFSKLFVKGDVTNKTAEEVKKLSMGVEQK